MFGPWVEKPHVHLLPTTLRDKALVRSNAKLYIHWFGFQEPGKTVVLYL